MSGLHALQDWLLAHAGEWWSYGLTGVLCWIDGFFPPLPSESIVIAMASMGLRGEHGVNLWLLVPLVLVGAFLGDNTAYWLGRLVALDRLLRGERGRRVLARARAMLEHRPAEVLLTARFIPLYRVAINLTAGALRFPWRTFAAIDAAASALWTAFCIGIGTAAGEVFGHNPLIGVAVGVALGLLLGKVVEKLAAAWRDRHPRDAG